MGGPGSPARPGLRASPQVEWRAECERAVGGKSVLHEKGVPRGWSPKEPDGILKRGILALIVVLSAEIFDFCLREIQLSLCELDNGREPKVIVALGEVEGKTRLAKKLRGHVDPLKGSQGAGPSHTHIPGNAILLIPEVLVGFERAVAGRLTARRKQVAIEHRDLHIHSGACVLARDGLAGELGDFRDVAGHSDQADVRPRKVFFGLRKLVCRLAGITEAG